MRSNKKCRSLIASTCRRENKTHKTRLSNKGATLNVTLELDMHVWGWLSPSASRPKSVYSSSALIPTRDIYLATFHRSASVGIACPLVRKRQNVRKEFRVLIYTATSKIKTVTDWRGHSYKTNHEWRERSPTTNLDPSYIVSRKKKARKQQAKTRKLDATLKRNVLRTCCALTFSSCLLPKSIYLSCRP